ncbi:MAG: metallophosphoesterase [Myxococcota bacterium]|nr:metallophosphoesterase [Myxococcota bacterium]
MDKPEGAVRVLHVSDIHVDVPLRHVPLGGWAGKRLMGGANLVLRRGKHFRRVREKVKVLDRFWRERGVDLVLCTGDYTVLGTEAELAAARDVIAPLTEAPLGFVTVPGNHDVYVPDAVGRFERFFGDLLETDLPELRTDGDWPIVRLVGDTIAVVAVNSARPNPHPWRSSGRIPDPQIDGLGRILNDSRLAGRFVFVITHYAPRLASGKPDSFTHGLVNAEAFLAKCASLERGAILHGHVHHCFHVKVDGLRASLFGAGSTTQDDREGLWLFDIEPDKVTAARGGWVGDRYALTGSPFEVR